jgi:hypothetical protein
LQSLPIDGIEKQSRDRLSYQFIDLPDLFRMLPVAAQRYQFISVGLDNFSYPLVQIDKKGILEGLKNGTKDTRIRFRLDCRSMVSTRM